MFNYSFRKLKCVARNTLRCFCGGSLTGNEIMIEDLKSEITFWEKSKSSSSSKRRFTFLEDIPVTVL